jgi:hypothetical protein
MLKFVVEPKERARPALIGLGLSFENLRRLRRDAVQFQAADLGLDPGVFVIVHEHDAMRAEYQAQLGRLACEVLVLSEATCHALEHGQELVRLPLRPTLRGRAAEALVFAGPTEALLLDALRAQGLLAPDAKVWMPTTSQPPLGVVAFRVGLMNRLKLVLGGVGFIVVAALCATHQRLDDTTLLVTALMGVTSAVFWVLLLLRWNERIELDGEGIRRVHPLWGFHLGWDRLSHVLARRDALGPYQIQLVRRVGGRPEQLERIYDDWDVLVDEIVARAGR